MKKIIFIGKNSCGKTSLCQLMKGEEVRDKKTQTIEIYVNEEENATVENNNNNKKRKITKAVPGKNCSL